MTEKITPRHLDPKFQDAKVPTDEAALAEAERTANPTSESDSRTDTSAKDSQPDDREPEGGWIAHTRRWVGDDGKRHEKTDRMPISEWDAYAKEWDI